MDTLFVNVNEINGEKPFMFLKVNSVFKVLGSYLKDEI
jgi:hypothetical protein